MPNFVFAFHGGKKPETPEGGKQMMEEWLAWMEASREKFVDIGHPVGMSKTVSAKGVEDNGGSNPLSGYSVIKADTIEEACELASSCPHLNYEGSIEVAEAMDMDMEGKKGEAA